MTGQGQEEEEAAAAEEQEQEQEMEQEMEEEGDAASGEEGELEHDTPYAKQGLKKEFVEGDLDQLISNWCKNAHHSVWLDCTVVVCIVINTVVLSIQSPANVLSDAWLQVLFRADVVITVLFSCEMFIRIIAMGFYNSGWSADRKVRVGERMYLNDPWNRLDFLIVLSSWLTALIEIAGMNLGIELSTLRALRVLRLLRSLRFFSGIKTILVVVAEAIPYSLDVLSFMAFVAVVSGIIGVQMFRGRTLSRCEYAGVELQAELLPDMFPMISPSKQGGSSSNGSDWSTVLNSSHPSPRPLVMVNFTALAPDAAALCLSTSPLDRQRCVINSRRTPVGRGSEFPIGIGIWVTYCTVDPDCPLYNRADQWNRTQVCVPGINPGRGAHNFDNIGEAFVALYINMACLYWWETAHRMLDANDGMGSDIAWAYGAVNVILFTYVSVNMFVAVITTVFADVRGAEKVAEKLLSDKQVQSTDGSGDTQSPWAPPWYYVPALGGPNGPHNLTYTQSEKKTDGQNSRPLGLINHPRFDNVIMFLILLNTIMLSLDHHDPSECTRFSPLLKCQSELFVSTSMYTNYFFNACFLIECILKILGMGFTAYIAVAFNKLDFFIVLTSLLDMIGEAVADDESSNGLFTLFRILRLFRVLRVARFLYKNKNLQRVVKTIFGSGSALANLGAFVLFCIMLFGIVGMHLFGGNWHPANNRTSVLGFGSCTQDDSGLDVECIADNGGTIWGRMVGDGHISVKHDGNAVTYRYDVGDLIRKGLIPRRNFEDFPRAFLLAFQIMTGDDWVNQMHDHLYVFNDWAPALFFFFAFAFMSYILLSLFIAVILENFEVAEEEKMKLQTEAMLTKAERAELKRQEPKVYVQHRMIWLCGGRGRKRGTVAGFLPEDLEIHPLNGSILAADDPTARLLRAALDAGVHKDDLQAPVYTPADLSETGEQVLLVPASDIAWTPPRATIIDKAVTLGANRAELQSIADEMPAASWYNDDNSLFMLAPGTGIRLALVNISTNFWFDAVVIVAIILGTVLLALEGPPGSLDTDTVAIFDAISTVLYVLFLMEFVIKAGAQGLMFTPNAYFKDSWNRLDFTVIAGSTIMILGGNVGPVRLLRCLRPLRVLRRIDGMRLIIVAIESSFAVNMGVMVVACLAVLIFSILAVALFGGQFYSCNCSYVWPLGVTPLTYTMDGLGLASPANDSGPAFRLEEVLDKRHCLGPETAAGHWPGGIFGVDPSFPNAVSQCYWDNRPYHFDTVDSAMMSLMTASTLAGWTDIMEIAMDARGIDQQPIPFANPFAAIFFVAYVIVLAFFVTNIFIGVLIDFISHHDGSALLTEQQIKLNDMERFRKMHRPTKAENAPEFFVRKWFYGVVESVFWDRACNAIIIFNVIVMMCEYEGMTNEWFLTLELLNMVCLWFFSFDMIFKLIGYFPIRYWRSNWNKFDAIVVLVSWAAIIFDASSVQAIRALRCFRIVLVLKSAKGLRAIFQVLTNSIYPAINIGQLLCLLFALYSILGMQLFGNAPLQDLECLLRDGDQAEFCDVGTDKGWWSHGHDAAPADVREDFNEFRQAFSGISQGRPGHMLMGMNRQYTHHSSFRDFFGSLRLLWQCMSGQDWKFVMYAVGGEPNSGAGAPRIAFLFFFSFYFLANYILLNMFIAVILDNFEASMRESDLDISEKDFDKFKYLFRSFTTDQQPDVLAYTDMWALLRSAGGMESAEDPEQESPFSPPLRELWDDKQEVAWRRSLQGLSPDAVTPWAEVESLCRRLHDEGHSPTNCDGQPGYDEYRNERSEDGTKKARGQFQEWWIEIVRTPGMFVSESPAGGTGGDCVAEESQAFSEWDEFAVAARRALLPGPDGSPSPQWPDRTISVSVVREAMLTLRFRLNFRNVLRELMYAGVVYINPTSTLRYDEVLLALMQNKMGVAALTLEEQIKRGASIGEMGAVHFVNPLSPPTDPAPPITADRSQLELRDSTINN